LFLKRRSWFVDVSSLLTSSGMGYVFEGRTGGSGRRSASLWFLTALRKCGGSESWTEMKKRNVPWALVMEGSKKMATLPSGGPHATENRADEETARYAKTDIPARSAQKSMLVLW